LTEFSVKLFSKKYQALNAQLHRNGIKNRPKKKFGADGHKWVEILQPILYRLQIKSLLDYGCGKETFWKALKDSYGEWGELPEYVGYDPCVKEREAIPKGQFDLVVCTDVLEHVEPEYLDNVLAHIQGFVRKVAFFNIALLEARTILPDGRNAHRIVEDADWWRRKLLDFFPFQYWRWQEINNSKPYKRLHLLMWKM